MVRRRFIFSPLAMAISVERQGIPEDKAANKRDYHVSRQIQPTDDEKEKGTENGGIQHERQGSF